MDIYTIVILGLLAAALSWWFSILIVEERQLIKQCKKDAIDKLARADRIRSLSGKL